MAYDVYIKVTFRDAGPFDVEKTYLLPTQLAVGGANWAAVQTDADALVTELSLLSWDQIINTDLIVRQPITQAAANVAANNSVEAFHRMTDSVTGEDAHIIVPAWDDAVYDKLPNGAMSAAYNTDAAALATLTRNPATGNAWTYVQAQNRATKRGQRQFKP